MTIQRDDLDTVRTARIICARPAYRHGRRKCHVCGDAATVLCDHPGEGGMCSRPCCNAHARYWTRGKHVCVEHAREVGCY